MKKILEKNELLDELEEIVRPIPFALGSLPPRSLTLKTSAGYLESKGHLLADSRINWLNAVILRDDEPADTNNLKSNFARFIKRCFDLMATLVGLILTIPLWLIIPLLIKLDSKGPVFYTQTRVGRNRRESRRRLTPHENPGNSRRRERRRENAYGETFKILKFRTMIHHAERDSGPVWAAPNDPRITRVGAFLRKLRLDEIPQFINVLFGEMSLIGPRPERPSFVRDLAHNINSYDRRHFAKPGITGLAQINTAYDSSQVTVAEKLKFDLYYIENWSLWLDVKILFQTVGVVLTGKGAR